MFRNKVAQKLREESEKLLVLPVEMWKAIGDASLELERLDKLAYNPESTMWGQAMVQKVSKQQAAIERWRADLTVARQKLSISEEARALNKRQIETQRQTILELRAQIDQLRAKFEQAKPQADAYCIFRLTPKGERILQRKIFVPAGMALVDAHQYFTHDNPGMFVIERNGVPETEVLRTSVRLTWRSLIKEPA